MLYSRNRNMEDMINDICYRPGATFLPLCSYLNYVFIAMSFQDVSGTNFERFKDHHCFNKLK